jgi:hypothetical protein
LVTITTAAVMPPYLPVLNSLKPIPMMCGAILKAKPVLAIIATIPAKPTV